MAANESSGISVSNFPNPFSNSKTISFPLPQSENVSVNILDMTGKIVITFVENEFEAGENKIEWNFAGMKAVIYLLKFEAGDFS